MTIEKPVSPPKRESRLLRVELRATADKVALRGYATVWDAPYEMYGGPERGGWIETIARGAANKTLAERPDVRLLVNHDGVPLARTRSGTLRLAADDYGLLVEAEDLDARSPLVQTLRSALERKDMDEMSFAFRVVKQEWDGDYESRVITEFSLRNGDVSVVTYPANPATVVQLDGSGDPGPKRGMPLSLARATAALLDD